MFYWTEPAAAGGITGPVDQHSAAAGCHATCSQLWDVHHGGSDAFLDVLELPEFGCPAYETELVTYTTTFFFKLFF